MTAYVPAPGNFSATHLRFHNALLYSGCAYQQIGPSMYRAAASAEMAAEPIVQASTPVHWLTAAILASDGSCSCCALCSTNGKQQRYSFQYAY